MIEREKSVRAYVHHKPTHGKFRIVIVGAGAAGLTIAQHIVTQVVSSSKKNQKQIHVSLIDKKDFHEFIPNALRAMVNPEEFDNCLYQLDKYNYGKGGNECEPIVQSVALDLDSVNKTVIIQRDGVDYYESVPYDYLVLATGSLYSSRYIKASTEVKTIEERREELLEFIERLKSKRNKHVVVVGGGSVGVELVGELIDFRADNPEAKFKITLVHGNARLVERAKSESLHDYIIDYFKQCGVEILLNDKVLNLQHSYDNENDFVTTKPKKLIFSSGKVIPPANMIFWCMASKPVTEWLQNSGLEFDQNGRIVVDDTLRTTTDPHIFAVGDINNVKCEKQAYIAISQAELTAKNIAVLINSPSSTLSAYHPPSANFAGIVSLGKKKAAVVANGKIVSWGRVAAFMKRYTIKNAMSRFNS